MPDTACCLFAAGLHWIAQLDKDRPFDLFVSQRAALVDYATPLVGDRGRAEDIVQEAFLRFAPAADSIAATEQPVAYLFRMVRNLAFDWKRRRQVERRGEQGEPEWWMVPAAARTPEQELIHAQTMAKLEAAMATLAPDIRLALEMHRFGGFRLAEVAEHMGWSLSKTHRVIRDALTRVVVMITPADEA